MANFTTSSMKIQNKFHEQPSDILMKKIFEKNHNTNPDGEKFGICDIITSHIIEQEVVKKPKKIHIIADSSGSMDDPQSNDGGKTKMEQVKFILRNILHTFSEQNIQISLTLDTFSDEITNIFKNQIITEENIEKLINLINKIRPDAGTNIELALQTATSLCDEDIENDFEKDFILLTDGDATSGNCSQSCLIDLVSDKMTNSFCGIGSQHNSALLTGMAKKYSGEYSYMNVREKSPFIIGEILSSIIKRISTKTTLTIENGLVYNYITNTWVKSLNIGSLSIGKTLTYQIKSSTPEMVQVHINGFDMNNQNISIISSNLMTFQDLTEYMFRQLVQEAIFSSLQIKPSDSLEKIDSMKNKILSLYDSIKEFQNRQGLEQGKGLLGVLLDDLFVISNTVGRFEGNMYSNSRQTSQGRQTTCRANFTSFKGNIPHQYTQDCEDDETSDFHTVVMMRGISSARKGDDSYDIEKNEELFENPKIKFRLSRSISVYNTGSDIESDKGSHREISGI